MKRLIPFLFPLLCLARTDTYDIAMSLHVPAVFDNAESRGYRDYRPQKIAGTMTVVRGTGEPLVSMDLTNATQVVGGSNVTYRTVVRKVGWHAIGSNKTGDFRKASVSLSIEAAPNYALVGDADDTLVVTLSGEGGTDAILHGFVAGEVGCACGERGHTSPTRIYGTDVVVDTAAVWGSWRARRR